MRANGSPRQASQPLLCCLAPPGTACAAHADQGPSSSALQAAANAPAVLIIAALPRPRNTQQHCPVAEKAITWRSLTHNRLCLATGHLQGEAAPWRGGF